MAYNKLIDLNLLNKFLNKIKNSFASKDVTTQTTVGPANIITFDASIGNMPVKQLTVNVEPVQAGSGDPSPTNVRPISGWTGANVTRTGKNLLNLVESEMVSSGWNRSFPINVKAGTYIISCLNQFGAGSTFGVRTVLRDSDNNTVVMLTSDYTFGNTVFSGSAVTITEKQATLIKNITFECRAGGATASDITRGNIQLELGSTATAYEPYTGNIYTIALGDTVYGGTLDVTNGVLTDNGAYLDLSTKTWTWNGDKNWWTTTLIDAKKPQDEQAANILCSNSKVVAATAIGTESAICIALNSNKTLIYKNFDSANSPTGQLVYELETPPIIEFTLTPTEVTTLLGTNNIWADTGPVTVKHGNYIGMTLDLVSEKADKVQNATADNFAALDADGNLKDSGHKASDFLTEHQSLAAYRTAAAQDEIDNGKQAKITASGLLKGNGSGGVSAAIAGTDYQTPLTAGTDYETPAGAKALGLTSASVGDLVRVAAIDANGKPTSWNHVPLCEIKTNPNLLDNWYFVGGGSQRTDKTGCLPINQRGLQIYSGYRYSIDRWLVNSSLQVDNGYITIPAEGSFIQNLEPVLSDSLVGRTVTASILLTGDVLLSGTAVISANYNTYFLQSDNITLYMGTHSRCKGFFVYSVSGLSILAVKLELGSEQTLAHQENG